MPYREESCAARLVERRPEHPAEYFAALPRRQLSRPGPQQEGRAPACYLPTIWLGLERIAYLAAVGIAHVCPAVSTWPRPSPPGLMSLEQARRAHRSAQDMPQSLELYLFDLSGIAQWSTRNIL